MANEFDTGATGEKLATAFLRKNGYEILNTNWRYKQMEVDIIAFKDNIVVIAEVKTRSQKSANFEMPHLAVTRQKQKNLIIAANAYVLQFDYDCDTRFDIVGVIFTEKGPVIEHIEDAFYPIVR